MKVGVSFLSKVRSFAGVEVGYGGYLKINNEGIPVLVRTVDLSIGFIFGWFTFGFNSGEEVRLDEINESIRKAVISGKKISTNE